MKNQYVGDINDYLKYSLIEIVSEVLNEKVLIAWMLTEDDNRNDGNKLDYLKNERNERQSNPELFDKLKSIDKNKRRIDEVQKLLGDKYNFYSKPLSDNKEERTKYFELLIVEAEKAGLVLFDPDNGIEVKSVNYGNKKSSKYLYWKEIQQFAENEKDILIYQHFPRKERKQYVEDLKMEIQAKTKFEVLPIETANVLFLLATKQGNKLDEIKRKWESKDWKFKKKKLKLIK
jgi:hypothetical protein